MIRTARIAAIGAGLLVLWLAVGCGGKPEGTGTAPRPSGAPTAPSSFGTPRPAPDFSVTALDGTEYRFADLKGTPIVLNFWTSSCPACAQFAPYLQAFYEKTNPGDIVFLAISPRDSAEALKRKAESLGVTYPIAIDEPATRAYQVRAIPMTFFIDREGAIAASILGARDRDTIEAALERIR